MRKLMASLGFTAARVALARLLFTPLFLAKHANDATGLLLGAGLFNIAIAAAVRKSAAREPAFFYGARRAS